MDDNKIIAAILTAPIITQLGGGGVDVPPEVAVSVYEEVLIKVIKSEEKSKKG